MERKHILNFGRMPLSHTWVDPINALKKLTIASKVLNVTFLTMYDIFFRSAIFFCIIFQ
jgi:hypothetical protein